MFSTSTATINNNAFDSNYMNPGINENVTLKDVSVETSTQGKQFLKVSFEDEAGKTADFTEWENTKGLYVKTDEDLQNANNRQFGRIIQIINCYFEKCPEVELNTFVDMINWVKSTLTPLIPTKKKLRLKVIYDKKGYVTVSKNGLYVEPMDVKDSQIKMFARDLTERPIQADVEKPVDPLAPEMDSIPEAENKIGSDLPF